MVRSIFSCHFLSESTFDPRNTGPWRLPTPASLTVHLQQRLHNNTLLSVSSSQTNKTAIHSHKRCWEEHRWPRMNDLYYWQCLVLLWALYLAKTVTSVILLNSQLSEFVHFLLFPCLIIHVCCLVTFEQLVGPGPLFSLIQNLLLMIEFQLLDSGVIFI